MARAKKTAYFCLVMSALVLVPAAIALADGETAPQGGANSTNESRAPRRWSQSERMAGEQIGERLIDRLLASAKLTTEIGLTNDTVAKLREESHALQIRQIDLDAQIRKLSLTQADRSSKLLQASDANTNEVMKSVEEIGRLRTEQAKLAVQNLMVVRKYLTPEQIRKARDLMRERMQNNGEARPAKREKNAAASAGTPPPKPPEGW